MRYRLEVVALLLFGGLLGIPPAAAAQNELAELVEGLLADPDRQMRSLALEQVRDATGSENTVAFAQLLPGLEPVVQVELLGALSDRGDGAAAPAVRRLLETTGESTVRLAAIEALGRVGGKADIAPLLALAHEGTEQQRQAAQSSLTRLPGKAAEKALIETMVAAAPALKVLLIDLLAERRARDATSQLLAAALAEDSKVRRAAMNALGELGAAEDLPGMIRGVLKAEAGSERTAAEKQIARVCSRAADQQASAALVKAVENLPSPEQPLLLSTLGRVGGKSAAAVVQRAAQSPDAKLHALGVEALCNWPDATVADQLVQLAQATADERLRRKICKALVRIAPLPDGRSDDARLALVEQVMALCDRGADRRRLLDRVKAIRTVEALRLVVAYLNQPAFAEQAGLTVVELAHHSKVREAHREEFHAALDRVIAASNDPVVVDRARRYKAGKTWVRPK